MRHKTTVPFIVFFVIVFFVFLTGCCSDYTGAIKGLIKPMERDLISFIKANDGVYPTEEERDAMLEGIGCMVTDSEKRICMHNGRSYRYESNLELSRHLYFFAFEYKGSHCSVNISEEGVVEGYYCDHERCIVIDP